jgi:hypothetical protein
MFFVILGATFVIPKALELTNRFLEEYVIPLQAVKKGEKLYDRGFDVVLTMSEIRKLKENGSMDIIQCGVHRFHRAADAGQVKLCAHCARLHN